MSEEYLQYVNDLFSLIRRKRFFLPLILLLIIWDI